MPIPALGQVGSELVEGFSGSTTYDSNGTGRLLATFLGLLGSAGLRSRVLGLDLRLGRDGRVV